MADLYDPAKAPKAEVWSALDESLRIRVVQKYHREHKIRIPNARLHATFHVIVENQLAMGEAVVEEALALLRAEGLSRHDAIHAIGMVLVGHVHAIAAGELPEGADPNEPYFEELKSLTAETWRNSG